MSVSSKTVIKNVRIFDGQSIGECGSVVMDGDKIGTDATEATIIDGQGGILLPGFIDCHVHLLEVEHLKKLSRYGVTTALDMGMNSIDVLRSFKGHNGLTDIRGCGMTATRAGSRHSRLPGRSPESLLANAEDAERFVKDRELEGTDYIKIIVDVPDGPNFETVRALVTNAHQYGKLTIAHASSYHSVRLAQAAGVDILTHSPMDKVLDIDDVETMIRDGRQMVPTLSMMEGVVKSGRIPHLRYSNAQDSVTAAYKGGVPILVGTDANMAPGVPANIPHGDSLHHEMELLVRAGMSTVDVLRGATSLAAKYFGLDDRGQISPGKRADLVLISENPIENIRATRAIKRVWCGGNEVANIVSSSA